MRRLTNLLSPVKLLIGTLVLTLLLIGWLSWNVYVSYNTIEMTVTQDVRLAELRGIIINLDEVLTMSARLAATTGDAAWVQRYETFVPQLDSSIQEAIRLVPQELGAQIRSETDQANGKLVALETQALAAVKAGHTDEARTILFGSEYEANKRIYANGMAKLLDYLQNHSEVQLQQGQQRLVRILISIAILLPILLAIWVAVLKYLQASASVREQLLVTQTREKMLEQTQLSQEAIITERTAALQIALQTAEVREACLIETLTALQTSETTVRELSAPIIPVLKGVLVAPMIGALNNDRAMMLSERVLHTVEQQRAHTIIFDITGVPVVDTQVANVILRTAAALRLLGATPLLVGIRPEVAQTIVNLGIDLTPLRTFPYLQEAIAAL